MTKDIIKLCSMKEWALMENDIQWGGTFKLKTQIVPKAFVLTVVRINNKVNLYYEKSIIRLFSIILFNPVL